METLNFDVDYIFKRSGFESHMNVSDFTFPYANQKEDFDRHQRTTKEYLNKLTSQQRQKLLDIYLPDFLIFGYDTNYYEET